uniref:P-type domain-containing protein n=1 Tax=Stegastes partitus TaxID=144197 RepID=A0A3B5AJ43_9TELE
MIVRVPTVTLVTLALQLQAEHSAVQSYLLKKIIPHFGKCMYLLSSYDLKNSELNFVPQCPNIPVAERVDCYPDAGASKVRRGCCWSPLNERNAPWCFFSTNHGYTVVSDDAPTAYELNARLKRLDSPSLFGGDIQELQFHAEMQTSNRLHFKIYDPNNKRFEVPHEHVRTVNSDHSSPIDNTLSIRYNPFVFTMFDTMGPLVFADQYLQLSAKLPSHNIYGLGEHVHQQYRHDTNWRTWPIFTRDAFPNGVTLQPAPAVTFRTIGGVLDFYIVFGYTPEQVVQEFLELIGRPVIPPYWSLGFQLSRWNYGSLAEVKATVERNRAVSLPYDIQYTDIDYMEDKKIFTYDKEKFSELPQFAEYLHEKGQKYILILDPAVATSKRLGGAPYEAYDRGTSKNAWVTLSDGKTPLRGEVWPGETVFPDYTNQDCINWWVDEYARLHREINHDALWIVSWL